MVKADHHPAAPGVVVVLLLVTISIDVGLNYRSTHTQVADNRNEEIKQTELPLAKHSIF